MNEDTKALLGLGAVALVVLAIVIFWWLARMSIRKRAALLADQPTSQEIVDAMHKIYGSPWPMFPEALKPTREQILAATAAGAAFASIKHSVALNHELIASDALQVARQIILQSEKSDPTQNQTKENP